MIFAVSQSQNWHNSPDELKFLSFLVSFGEVCSALLRK